MAFVAQVGDVAFGPPVYFNYCCSIDYFIAIVTVNFFLVCDPLNSMNQK